jgi:cytoskeletal protein CcmA (bactofilin family)
MRRKKPRFPSYRSVIGPGTQVTGTIRFDGGLHVDGRIVGDVTGRSFESGVPGSAISIGATGVIEGNLDVPHVVTGGTVYGDVRAAQRAVLAAGARIQGTLFYGALEMDKGAEVDGKLVPLDATGAVGRKDVGNGAAESRDRDEEGTGAATGGGSPGEGVGHT